MKGARFTARIQKLEDVEQTTGFKRDVCDGCSHFILSIFWFLFGLYITFSDNL